MPRALLCFEARLSGMVTYVSMLQSVGCVACWLVLRCKVAWLDDLCFDARLSGLMTCAPMQGCAA